MKISVDPKVSPHFWGCLIFFLHIVGIVGTILPATRALTVSLTPINLMVSLAILLFSFDYSRRLITISLIIFAAGYLLEVAGVKTGILFGQYAYGPTLGFSVFDVPLVMGVNWVMLCLAFSAISLYFFQNFWLKVLTAALLMVMLDVLIEPVAIKLDYWQWEGDVIPFRNYLTWFIASAALNGLLLRFEVIQKNIIAIYLIMSQIIYFIFVYFFL